MHHVVIVGGGYGGLRLIEKLVKSSQDIAITLVDAHGYHYLQTEVYGYIAGTRDIYELAVDLQSWCNGFSKKIDFIQKRLVSVEVAQKSIELSDAQRLYYDTLVIATGATTHFYSSIPGLKENSIDVKSLPSAFEMRQWFENSIHSKLDGDKEELHIAIIGAGLSGVEVAAEIAYALQDHQTTLGVHINDFIVTLVDGCQSPLYGMQESVVREAQERLKDLGVVLKMNAFITKVGKNHLYFESGEELFFDKLLFTGGIVAKSEFVPQSFEKNKLGQLEVDAYLNIPNHKDIFAIGDVADIQSKEGVVLPPTAQVAERSVEYVAEVIINRLLQKPLKVFDMKILGMFVALGGRYGVGELFGFVVKGKVAYILKKLISFIYFFGIAFRANSAYKIRTKFLKRLS